MRMVSVLGVLPVMLFVLILSFASPLTAQITFQRTYGGEANDYGYSTKPTADGGYIITGCTWSFGAGYYDAWLIKTDAVGDTMWTRTYGGVSGDYGYSVAQTADGGYVIAGRTWSFGAGREDVWLIKTDASGDTMWTRTYGGEADNCGRSVAQTADGGYVITGYTESSSAGYLDVWLIKTDAVGDTMWTRTYGDWSSDEGYSVAQTADGGYIIAGESWSYQTDVWLIKTDSAGDTTWTRTYGSISYDAGFSVAQTADGGYVVVGYTRSFGAGESDVYMVKTDSSGDRMWTRTFGGEDFDRGWSVAQTADGGYVIVGETRSFGAGWRDVWLIRTDASGDTIWTRTFGGAHDDVGSSVRQTADGGYVITGYTWSFGLQWPDAWLIKTDSAGRVAVAIAEPKPPVAHKPARATIVRGVLFCPVWSATTPSLRNVSDIALHNSVGRKVMDLHAGPNDVRHVSPGIYFVRQASSVHKVVLTR